MRKTRFLVKKRRIKRRTSKKRNKCLTGGESDRYNDLNPIRPEEILMVVALFAVIASVVTCLRFTFGAMNGGGNFNYEKINEYVQKYKNVYNNISDINIDEERVKITFNKKVNIPLLNNLITVENNTVTIPMNNIEEVESKIPELLFLCELKCSNV